MRSNKAIATTLILIAVTSINSVAAADVPFATPDRNGDYASNYAPIQGKIVGRGDMAGSLWHVAASGLNCRVESGLQFPIVRSFTRGTILQANVGRAIAFL